MNFQMEAEKKVQRLQSELERINRASSDSVEEALGDTFLVHSKDNQVILIW